MQYSIDEFEFRMNEFSELLKQDSFSKDRTHKLQNDCKYFATLFADLLRENYKLKDQIIDHLRQISAYREELQRITFDTDQTTQEDRKFSKEMASVELLVKYLVEDQKFFYKEKERLVLLALQKDREREELIEEHKKFVKQVEENWLMKKNKWKEKFKKQIEKGEVNVKQIQILEEEIIQLKKEIETHLQNIATYEQEITRKDLKIQYYQKQEQEFQAKQTDIDIKHDFAMKELQKKYRNEMKELKIQNANNLKQLQNNYEDKFQILQRNAEVYQAQLEQKTNEFMKLSGEYDALIQLYKQHKDKSAIVIQDFENQVTNLSSHNQALKNELEQTKEDLQATKKQLKSSKEETYKLQADVQQLQKEIKSLNLQIQSLENKIKDKVERFQRLQDQINKDHLKQLQKQKEELVQQSEYRLNLMQKNAQEQYDYLMRTKNIEISKLKGQVDGLNSKFEQHELIHKDLVTKLEQQNQIKLDEANEKQTKLKEELNMKDQQINALDQEIQMHKNLLTQKDHEIIQKLKDQQNTYQEEINVLRDGVEILIKTAKKPLEDKIISLTQQCEQKQGQIQTLQNQYTLLQQKYIDSEQRSHERISQLQDELNMSMNIFNKMNDNLGSKLQKMMDQTRTLQDNYQILNEQIKSKNQEIINLQQEIKNKEESRAVENRKHQKTVKELQIYIGNKEVEMNQLNQQYVELVGINKQLNQKIKTLTEIQEKEKENQQLEKRKLEKQLSEQTEQIKLITEKSQKELQIQLEKQKSMQQQYEQQINTLQIALQKEYSDKETQTESIIQSAEKKKQKQNYNPNQQKNSISSESEYNNQNNDRSEVSILQREKAELIIHYEKIIEQLTQQDNSDSKEQGIKIVEKIVYREQPKKENAIQGLDVIVKQTQMEMEEVKERAQLEKQEHQEYVNQLTQRFQEIMRENEQEYQDLNEQISILKGQITQLQKDNNYLKQDMIEQELKYQIQIQQMKEQSDVQLNTLTETCNQEIEEYKKKYEEKYVQFEQLRKQYQERMAKPEDTEIIQRLLKDHQELYLLVVNAYDKVKEAGDIIRYLDLEVQNYKKVNDIFGGQQQQSQPPPSLSTQKMIQKVAQIKQELELTQNKIQQKKSENTIGKEGSNMNDDKQLSHLSEFSEINSKIQLDSKLPSKRKKLPKMMTSMRSNFSDAQPSSQNQTSRLVEERGEVPLFKFDQEEQILLEAPISFNAFVDQRQHGNSQMSQQRQNKYTAYIEKKKKDMINISDIVQQQSQMSPAEQRYSRKKQENQQQQPKKFVPYYLRNPEIQPKYKNVQKIQ